MDRDNKRTTNAAVQRRRKYIVAKKVGEMEINMPLA